MESRMKVCAVYCVLCIPPEAVIERDVILRKKLLLKVQSLKPQPLPTGNSHKERHRRIKYEAVDAFAEVNRLISLCVGFHDPLLAQPDSYIALTKLTADDCILRIGKVRVRCGKAVQIAPEANLGVLPRKHIAKAVCCVLP